MAALPLTWQSFPKCPTAQSFHSAEKVGAYGKLWASLKTATVAPYREWDVRSLLKSIAHKEGAIYFFLGSLHPSGR
ncbi:hypothetical protein Syun_030169 [Stephania yunnanensis]|uniref:Uncharacterized protein n=1 Tax=Stephania yunnanensis TaxID=152371 RepID=A0AAP0E6U4_9MAGN